MGKLTPYFAFGNKEDLTIEGLLDVIDRMYADLADAINRKPDLYERDVDGQVDDAFLSNGSININETTGKVEMLTEHVDSTTVTWTTLS